MMRHSSSGITYPYYSIICMAMLLLLLGSAFSAARAWAGASFDITKAEWKDRSSELKVEGRGGKGEIVTVKEAASGTLLGTATVDASGRWRFELESPSLIPCRVLCELGSLTAEKDVRNAPGDCGATTPSDPGGTPTPDPGGTPTGSHANRVKTYEGTATCLKCHEREAQEVHASVHYQWQGDASDTTGLDTPDAGKLGGINDFCIYPDINWIGKLTNLDGTQVDGGCAKCHVGLGEKPAPEATQSQLENIDCLICHSDSYKRKVEMVDGNYRFVPDTENMSVSLLQAASDITLPSKDTCLNCHTKAGGGNNFKRGDIEEAHRNATRNFDVHMASAENGGAGLSCLDCHAAESHKIAGRGSDLRPRDSFAEVFCTSCHSATPHENPDINKHTARIDCTVCHIPEFAKVAATDMERDWSVPGDLVPGKGLYEPHHVKGTNVTPVYRFFNGTSHFYQFGNPVVPAESGRVVMSAPNGDINDPNARIHAFKHHLGTQPVDPLTERLLPLKIGKFFESGDIAAAVELGAEGVGWGYNGHDFAQTERFLGLFHEVAPAEQALSCSSCHDGGTRLNFAELGYTPNETYNGRPLCASCHGDESGEWPASALFTNVHNKHVRGAGLDCSKCHSFSSAN